MAIFGQLIGTLFVQPGSMIPWQLTGIESPHFFSWILDYQYLIKYGIEYMFAKIETLNWNIYGMDTG